MKSAVLKKTMLNLKKNQFDPYYVATKEEVVPLIEELVPAGASVANGGSVSLKECGVMNLLESGVYDFIDRRKADTPEELRDYYIRAYGSDAFFCSSNAVTEDGCLYNVDGNSNRIACIAYGPKQVIMVVGCNKIVKDLDAAVLRVKTICAPKNCVQLQKDTYCAKMGQCVSLTQEHPSMYDGCDSAQRICCNYLVSGRQRHPNRVKVIIVGEPLGF